jgi:DNA ligase D-like protein (predicted 3'-phosphoesterase)
MTSGKIHKWKSRRNSLMSTKNNSILRGGDASSEDPSPRTYRFVIHKHRDDDPDYHLRLEVGEGLKSWTLPVGPSMDPNHKREAYPTADRGVEHIDFEGVLPEGQPDAGPTLVWDTGTYRNLRADKEDVNIPMEQLIAQGRVELWLSGKKLMGGFELLRTGDGGEGERWLLTKMDDDQAQTGQDITQTQPGSVLSGRSLAQISEEETRGGNRG